MSKSVSTSGLSHQGCTLISPVTPWVLTILPPPRIVFACVPPCMKKKRPVHCDRSLKVLVTDIDRNLFVFPIASRFHQRADLLGDAAMTADDPAHVVGCNTQFISDLGRRLLFPQWKSRPGRIPGSLQCRSEVPSCPQPHTPLQHTGLLQDAANGVGRCAPFLIHF